MFTRGEFTDEASVLLQLSLFSSPSGAAKLAGEAARLVGKASFGVNLETLWGLRLHGPTCQPS
jgi:hypothetical protein